MYSYPNVVYVCLSYMIENLNKDPRFQMMVSYLRQLDSNLIIWKSLTPPASVFCERLLRNRFHKVRKVKSIEQLIAHGPEKRDDFIDKILCLNSMIRDQTEKLEDDTTLVIIGHPRELTGLTSYQMNPSIREITKSSIRIPPFSVMSVSHVDSFVRPVFVQSEVLVPRPFKVSPPATSGQLSERFAQINQTASASRKKRSRKEIARLDLELDAYIPCHPRNKHH